MFAPDHAHIIASSIQVSIQLAFWLTKTTPKCWLSLQVSITYTHCSQKSSWYVNLQHEWMNESIFYLARGANSNCCAYDCIFFLHSPWSLALTHRPNPCIRSSSQSLDLNLYYIYNIYWSSSQTTLIWDLLYYSIKINQYHHILSEIFHPHSCPSQIAVIWLTLGVPNCQGSM